MRSYLILVENHSQMKFIVDKFNTIDYNVRKGICGDYTIYKRDETVKYYVRTQNETTRGYRFNGYIIYRVSWSRKLYEEICPKLIERYYDKHGSEHNIPVLELHCWSEEVFDNSIRLIENYDKGEDVNNGWFNRIYNWILNRCHSINNR